MKTSNFSRFSKISLIKGLIKTSLDRNFKLLQKKTIPLQLFVLALLLSGCEFSSDVGDGGTPGFEYPAKIGNTWNYHHVWENFNFRPDSLSYRRPNMTFEHKVEVIGDTILDNNKTCRTFMSTENNYNSKSYHYYSSEIDGFYMIAYTPGSILNMPKMDRNYKIKFAGRSFRNEIEMVNYFTHRISRKPSVSDTLLYLDPAMKVLPYPLYEYAEWLYGDNLFKIWKKVVGKVNVSTEAGEFECYKILWVYEENDIFPPEDFEIYEYVCEYGMIKRVMNFRNIAILSHYSPETIGYYDSTEEITLTDINF